MIMLMSALFSRHGLIMSVRKGCKWPRFLENFLDLVFVPSVEMWNFILDGQHQEYRGVRLLMCKSVTFKHLSDCP